MSATRIERDPLGELAVPAEALYGIQTERARRNFPISHLAPLAPFVDAVIRIKKAAALTHKQTKRLDPKLADAIVRAADEVLAGQHRDQFVVDPYQAGAGTSHNMNCNEVLANRANELLGGKRGVYQPVHPNDHVNMAQSTNDVIPTAIRLAALAQLPALLDALSRLGRAFLAKGKAFDRILKSGRTHLQDATPIRLGQEFTAYGHTIERHRDRVAPAEAGQVELNVMMPVIAHNLLFTMAILANATRVFAERCVEGIEADAAQCEHWLERSPALVTALAPKIGYAEAAKLAKEAVAKNMTVRQLVMEKGIFKGKDLEEVLDLAAMTEIGVPGRRKK